MSCSSVGRAQHVWQCTSLTMYRISPRKIPPFSKKKIQSSVIKKEGSKTKKNNMTLSGMQSVPFGGQTYFGI